MTVHKSQGSQFDAVAVVLPDADVADPHPRAALHRRHPGPAQLIVVGPEDSVRAAVERPIARATGLRERLWGARRLADNGDVPPGGGPGDATWS